MKTVTLGTLFKKECEKVITQWSRGLLTDQQMFLRIYEISQKYLVLEGSRDKTYSK